MNRKSQKNRSIKTTVIGCNSEGIARAFAIGSTVTSPVSGGTALIKDGSTDELVLIKHPINLKVRR